MRETCFLGAMYAWFGYRRKVSLRSCGTVGGSFLKKSRMVRAKRRGMRVGVVAEQICQRVQNIWLAFRI